MSTPRPTLLPELKRLLDELPRENPDADSTAYVWIPFCDSGPQPIPMDEPAVWVDFGRWCGPPMSTNQVMIHLRLPSGKQQMCRLATGKPTTLRAGDKLAVELGLNVRE